MDWKPKDQSIIELENKRGLQKQYETLIENMKKNVAIIGGGILGLAIGYKLSLESR